jgi:hypothetical protein
MSTATTDEEVLGPAQGRSRRRYDPSWDDWKKPRRWPGILLTCVIVLGFIGVVVWHYRPHSPHHHAAGSGQSSLPGGIPKPAYVLAASGPGATVKVFHGTKNAQGLKFSTDGKLLVLHAKCTCAYNFVVTIRNAQNTPIDYPVTAMGDSESSINLQLPAGSYTAQVIAVKPAHWTLQFIQPGPALTPIPTPFKYYSSDASVVGPFSSSNKFLFFKFFSQANNVARVYILNANGQRVDQPFLGRTEIYTKATLPNPSNPYYVEVVAGPFWQLRVQHSAKG